MDEIGSSRAPASPSAPQRTIHQLASSMAAPQPAFIPNPTTCGRGGKSWPTGVITARRAAVPTREPRPNARREGFAVAAHDSTDSGAPPASASGTTTAATIFIISA